MVRDKKKRSIDPLLWLFIHTCTVSNFILYFYFFILVNGRVVTPPVSTLPTTGAAGLLPGAQMQMGLINGSIGYNPHLRNPSIPNSTLPLLVPAAEELYPTVTLHSPASAVMCRFSAEDIVAKSHKTIGAPQGRTIYAVDGSVISFPDGRQTPLSRSSSTR